MEGDKGGLWLPAGGWLLEGGGAGWLVTVFRYRLAGGMWQVAGCWCGLHILLEGGWRREVDD